MKASRKLTHCIRETYSDNKPLSSQTQAKNSQENGLKLSSDERLMFATTNPHNYDKILIMAHRRVIIIDNDMVKSRYNIQTIANEASCFELCHTIKQAPVISGQFMEFI